MAHRPFSSTARATTDHGKSPHCWPPSKTQREKESYERMRRTRNPSVRLSFNSRARLCWRGQSLSRQFLVAHRRVIGEDGDHSRHLHHVFALHVIDRVHVGMVRARVIFQAFLYKLEARQSDGVERYVIG